jgi:hypothetical protein
MRLTIAVLRGDITHVRIKNHASVAPSAPARPLAKQLAIYPEHVVRIKVQILPFPRLCYARLIEIIIKRLFFSIFIH